MSKYLDFLEIPFKGKTKKFHVVSKSSCVPLAIIKWYPQWRQYTFFPYGETIWNKDCMNDIISFINNLMAQRKPKKKIKHSLIPIHIPVLCLVREEALREVLKHASPEVKSCFKLASKKQIKKWQDECAHA